MKKTKKILIGFAVLISLLIILPFFISMRTYLNEAESIASNKLGVPVTIGSGHLSLLPSPRIVASDISVGSQQEFTVVQVSVVPTLSSLFSATKVIDLKLSKPIVKQAAFDFISALSSKESESSGEPPSVNVRHITVDEFQLELTDTKLPVVNLDVNLSNTNAFESAKVETVDGTLKADVTPKGDEHLILIQAKKLTLPFSVPLLIDTAVMEMHLKDKRLEIPGIEVAIYGGKLMGNAVVSWGNKWHTTGKLNVQNISVKEPSRLVSKSVYLSGDLSGNATFSGTAKDAGALADSLRADFKFSVNNGVLHGVDLVKVASLLVKQSDKGGETKFDEFSALLNVTGKQYHLRDIKISSGLLAASGQVKIKSNKELDGAVEVELKRSVSLVAIPLDVSGTVSDPVVLPSKAALAGAIAGTAVLGPGVGTSLGIKAGGAIDKFKGLFQSK